MSPVAGCVPEDPERNRSGLQSPGSCSEGQTLEIKVDCSKKGGDLLQVTAGSKTLLQGHTGDQIQNEHGFSLQPTAGDVVPDK